MNRKNDVLWIVSAALLAAGCAGERVPPKALTDARSDYYRAKDGLAARLDPTDLHEAEIALQRAERSYDKDPASQDTSDLAIIADRKALLAEARAGTLQAQKDAQQATMALETARAQQLQAARHELSQSQDQLGRAQMQLQQQTSAFKEQQSALESARATIAQIASVKDDDRGMVVTLPSEVLFKTGKSDLKPAALAKLDEIAQALAGKEQSIVVYGFTDDVGTRDSNMALSTRRAQAVRDYLVSKGISKDLVEARGQGPDNPVADNTSIEGRAQNRRVEIVVEARR